MPVESCLMVSYTDIPQYSVQIIRIEVKTKVRRRKFQELMRTSLRQWVAHRFSLSDEVVK
jgi:hypothetical protein